MSTSSTNRTGDHGVASLFLDRWSPRAFDGSAMTDADLFGLLEAARWAPSSFNLQPWRFAYAHRGGPDWDRFLSLLIPFNQSWAKDASVLLFIASERESATAGKPPRPSYSHSFDAGAAWAHLALQATLSGFVTHGMTGFDTDAAPGAIGAPESLRIEAAIAIGRPGDPMTLAQGLREREAPSDRKPLASIVTAGGFRS